MDTQQTISTYADLLTYWSAENFHRMNRRAYKDTACGASVSVYGTHQGRPAARHNGQTRPGYSDVWPPEEIPGDYHDFPDDFVFTGFTVQTIVEGSEATVDSDRFVFGQVTAQQLDEWVEYMEAAAEELWLEANTYEDEESDDE